MLRFNYSCEIKAQMSVIVDEQGTILTLTLESVKNECDGGSVLSST